MPLYGDIDLHANNSVAALLNDQDQVIYQQRLPNPLPASLAPSSLPHGEIDGVLVESTNNWDWLVDGLMKAGYRVHLANPAAMQQYNGLKYTVVRDLRCSARVTHPLPQCMVWVLLLA